MLRPYPGIDAVMIDLGLTAQGRRLMDANIQILLDAGFDERGALLAYNVLHSYGVGRVTIESRLRHRPRPTAQDVSDRPALQRIRGAVDGLHAVDSGTSATTPSSGDSRTCWRPKAAAATDRAARTIPAAPSWPAVSSEALSPP